MALSPSKAKTLSRQASSPSLAVGLPPPLPESNIMTPSSSSHSLKRSRSHPRIHRGDVSSSANTSPSASDNELDSGWVLPDKPVPGVASADSTARRRVLGALEPTSGVSGKILRKRDSLTARLQQVARVKKSKSTGHSLNSSTSLPPTNFIRTMKTEIGEVMESTIELGLSGHGSDKVVVCVRSVHMSSCGPILENCP